MHHCIPVGAPHATPDFAPWASEIVGASLGPGGIARASSQEASSDGKGPVASGTRGCLCQDGESTTCPPHVKRPPPRQMACHQERPLPLEGGAPRQFPAALAMQQSTGRKTGSIGGNPVATQL